MTASTGVLPSYQRFANGAVPVSLFPRRSFRPREKYLILLVFLTFGVVCFGTFFFLPDFRTGGAAVNSVVNRVYQRMQQAGPELLLPVPPRASGDVKDSRSSAAGHPNAVPPGHEGSDHQDVHLVEDKQKLQAKIDEEYQQQKTLEKPDMGELRVRTSSSSSLHKEETVLVTVPPAPADKLPIVVGGEDKDHIARQRRDKVREVRLFSTELFRMMIYVCRKGLIHI
ncbi:Mannosyl-oligosaccharide 1,2-alpha-mannosidase IA [Ooceraea biroi]|uniref:Mannosyl-oligosaccharide 1,2-alpha-mannosidase IA n=1 Tax=Ooceraea biroi TaxID=2015173 RepID=A0A026VVZ3_OOCBI|nr:Mannosyl-oligosaccharide 1,2-alpha-mannosidase IA [Ooceraea biroi]